MGLIGSGIFNTYRGFRNSPAGLQNRLVNIGREVRLRSALTGVQFAAWGGMFSTIDCTLVAIRRKVIVGRG
jgi:import inner membrane translocase subunit TIM17